MKCFYHTDVDGACLAAIVHKAIGKGQYIQINYNMPFPFDTIEKDEEIIIVDFSLQGDGDFERLRGITPNITWIDHSLYS